MKYKSQLVVLLLSAFTLIIFSSTRPQQKEEASTKEIAVGKDPLPSWNNGASKKSIIDFVSKTTNKGSVDFIPEPDRIACFDNDGTLWSEQPMYFPLVFAFDRVKAIAPQHPEWKEQQPFFAMVRDSRTNPT